MVSRLIIENSGSAGNLIFAEDNAVRADVDFLGAGELARTVESVFRQYGNPEEVVIGTGPGSYTGMRIAIALAFGLRIATSCRCLGCPSVLGYDAEDYTVVGDARRATCFLAEIAGGRLARWPSLVPAAEITERTKETAGPIYFTSSISGQATVVLPRARYLLRRIESYSDLSEPIYLKEAHVTQPKDRR